MICATWSPKTNGEEFCDGEDYFYDPGRPTYDDLRSSRYHFPRTYLRQVEGARGDWIVYYEPRRGERRFDEDRRQAGLSCDGPIIDIIEDP